MWKKSFYTLLKICRSRRTFPVFVGSFFYNYFSYYRCFSFNAMVPQFLCYFDSIMLNCGLSLFLYKLTSFVKLHGKHGHKKTVYEHICPVKSVLFHCLFFKLQTHMFCGVSLSPVSFSPNFQKGIINFVIKKLDLTQSYDKSPYTHRQIKQQLFNIKTPLKL